MIVTLDFETLPITAPNLPPMPVGVALKLGNEPGRYFAWEHPTENNCERGRAEEILRGIWCDIAAGCVELVMHNALFDLSVAKKWFELPFPDPLKTHDTMLLAFLAMPYEARLSLKPLAERLLDWPPEERDRVVDWVVEHTRHPSGKMYTRTVPRSGETHFPDGSPKNAAAYIAYAPGGLVGEYAVGDVDRTYALFAKLSKVIAGQGMAQAYARERKLIPILAANQVSGMRIDVERGEELYRDAMISHARVSEWLRGKLKNPELNLDSDDDLREAMLEAGVIDRAKLLRTETGKESVSAKSLRLATDPALSSLIVYRRQLDKIGNTFILPWLKQGRQFGGKVYTAWNQVAQVRGGKGVGTRTGRFSTTPSFSNLPKVGEEEAPAELERYTGLSLAPVPQVRSLVIPWEPGWVLIDRDYSQQEVRISAHFGEGRLLEEYRKDPWMDVHQMTQDALEHEFGIFLHPDRKTARKRTKTVNFRLYYGGGVRGLMEALETDKENAAKIRDAVLAVNTGLRMMMGDVQRRANAGQPIRTWGGREYYCEDSEFDRPGRRAFAYKLVNYLIQGSAADNLKEVWVRLGLDPEWFRTYVTVHDEFLASVPSEMIHEGQERLRSAMEGVPFDLPMLSEGAWSPTDWAHLQDYDVHGRRVYVA